jgi:hypothetical protein
MFASSYSSTQLTRTEQVKGWCREGELNPQGTKYRRILSPLRLPVPPSRLGWASD